MLKIDNKMNVVDIDSVSNRSLGKLEVNEQGQIVFKRAKQQLGNIALPIRLSVREQEEICWIVDDYRKSIKL